MRDALLWILLASGLVAGCTKNESSPGDAGAARGQLAEATAPPSPRGLGVALDPPTHPTVIADTGDLNATLQQLTQALRDYVVRTRSVPKDFEEFAAKSQVRFPPAPEGKKYAIKGQAVVVAKR